MKTQLFQNAYHVAYALNEFDEIELSINNFLFTLKYDDKYNSSIIFDTLTGDYMDKIDCFQFDVNLKISDYPNDFILDYIVTNLID